MDGIRPKYPTPCQTRRFHFQIDCHHLNHPNWYSSWAAESYRSEEKIAQRKKMTILPHKDSCDAARPFVWGRREASQTWRRRQSSPDETWVPTLVPPRSGSWLHSWTPDDGGHCWMPTFPTWSWWMTSTRFLTPRISRPVVHCSTTWFGSISRVQRWWRNLVYLAGIENNYLHVSQLETLREP